jgi:hypothetical protein
MCFDRFDICEAWWVFLAEYHSGIDGYGFAPYNRFSQLAHVDFRPALTLDGRDDLTENGQAIYDALVARWERENAERKVSA